MNLVIVCMVLPAAIILLSTYLMWINLRNSKNPISWQLILGLAVLVLTCAWVFYWAKVGGLGVVFALPPAIATGIAAVISGVILAVVLRGKRRWFGVWFALLFPPSLFISFQFGISLSPESVIEQNGEHVIQAIRQHHLDLGKYPDTLDALIPVYLDDLREPSTVWGWLYISTDTEFSLGYVYGVDRYGYSVTVYTSSTSDWNSLSYSTGPFGNLPPTPGPLPYSTQAP